MSITLAATQTDTCSPPEPDAHDISEPTPEFIAWCLGEYRYLTPQQAEELAKAKIRWLISKSAKSVDLPTVEADFLLAKAQAAYIIICTIALTA